MKRSLSAGFTVIELLVATVIVLVLAALLLQALSMVRVRGEQATCSGNMRSVYSAIMQYAADNNGYLPASKPGIEFWGDGVVNNGYLTTEFMHAMCPTTAKILDYVSTVAYHSSVLGNTEAGAVGQVRMVNIQNPSKTCMLMDGHNSKNYFDLDRDPNNVLRNGQQIVIWSKDFIRPDGDYFPVGHGATLNVMFCDGHAEVIPKSIFWDIEKAREIFQPSQSQPFMW